MADHHADTEVINELYGQGAGDPDYNTPPWELEAEKPKVYDHQPPKPEYPEQDNWAGDPSEGWA